MFRLTSLRLWARVAVCRDCPNVRWHGSTAAAVAPACRAPQTYSRSYINVSSYETTWKEIYVWQFELDSAICGINVSFKSKRLRPIANTIKRQLHRLLLTHFAQSTEPILILLKKRNRVEINPFYGTFATANRSFSITSVVRLLLFRFQ